MSTNPLTLAAERPSALPRLGQDSAPPRVSVLMAVFNTARFLPDALKSIADQTFTGFELVVVDDGSTDGSTQVLRSFAAIEPRMRLIARGNLGLIATRNELLAAARGELIAWMDSDDVSLPDRLQLQVERFDNEPDLVCIGGVAQCVDPEGNALNIERYPLTHDEIRAAQREGTGMRFPTTMMRRDAATRVGGFREPFKMCEDLDLLLRLGEIGKLANLAATIYLYRQHLSSVCAALGPNWTLYRDRALALARERAETGQDQLQRGEVVSIAKTEVRDADVLVSQTYAVWARCALGNGNRRLAWRYAGAAVAARPTAGHAWRTWMHVALAWTRV